MPPLTCNCPYVDDATWYYVSPTRYTTMPWTWRQRHCESCGDAIKPFSLVGGFYCFRDTHTEIEQDIYGDEVPLASRYFCEECTDLYFSLTELGFCVPPGEESMQELAKEYARMYGPAKNTSGGAV